MNDVFLLYLIGSGITRIGVVFMLIFGVRILVTLYKYNVRLAAFYNAQADALELAPKSDIKSFSNLVRVLSPDHLDFEPTPGVNLKELSEVVQTLKDLQK